MCVCVLVIRCVSVLVIVCVLVIRCVPVLVIVCVYWLLDVCLWFKLSGGVTCPVMKLPHITLHPQPQQPPVEPSR